MRNWDIREIDFMHDQSQENIVSITHYTYKYKSHAQHRPYNQTIRHVNPIIYGLKQE